VEATVNFWRASETGLSDDCGWALGEAAQRGALLCSASTSVADRHRVTGLVVQGGDGRVCRRGEKPTACIALERSMGTGCHLSTQESQRDFRPIVA
jgi:hypothetical protein